jgi:two-component system CheB/CheR fusion protein
VPVPHASLQASSSSRLHLRQPFDLAPFEVPPLDQGEAVVSNDEAESTQSGVVAQLFISATGVLTHANPAAMEVLDIQNGDLSRPIQDLHRAVGFDEVIAAVEGAIEDGSARDLGSVHLALESGSEYNLDTQVFPLLEGGRTLGVTVLLADVESVSNLRENFQQIHAELETAYEELQSTNEELVTSNEELQSSYEELETTNEELQSANEELETTNEELRSSNEELEATNIELRSAGDTLEHMNVSLLEANDELNRFSTLHRHVMDNFPSAVIVLDSHLLIQEWNRAATDLWGLREDEVLGEPLFGLEFGLPLEALQEPVRACRSPGAATVTLDLEATNRLGRRVTCRVAVVPATGNDVPPSAMLLMQVVETDRP